MRGDPAESSASKSLPPSLSNRNCSESLATAARVPLLAFTVCIEVLPLPPFSPQQMKGKGESSGPRPDGSGHARRSSRRIAGKFSYKYSRRIADPYSCWIGGGSLIKKELESGTACGSLDMNSTWYDLVKDAKDRECFFKARDDDFFARTMDQFRLMQNSQVTDNVSRWNIECQCAPDAQLTCDNHATIPDKAPDAQLTGDNRATIPDKAQVVEPAHAEQVPMQSERAAEKTWQLCLNQLSHIPSFAPGEQLTDEKVVEPAHAKQVHLAQLSPSPSRERARLSQFAQGAQLTDEEAAALEEEDHPQIDLLDGLRRGGRLRGSGAARLAEVRRRRRSGVLTSMASLSSKHHVLIQVLLARGPLSERDFHAFIDGAFGKNTALGTKRLASEDLANDWDNKRLNPGNDNYPLSTGAANNLFLGIEQGAGSSNGQSAFPKFDNGSSVALPSGQGMSGLMGKGYNFNLNRRYFRQNGVTGTGCATTATITTMHLVRFATGAKLRKNLQFTLVCYSLLLDYFVPGYVAACSSSFLKAAV
ncbi:P-loop containing nucleoside triphosphate hydrolase superfamily protein [Zea mays]|uniref:p-loop containing nucleoside triphosphate hydrolase superfamily protein n=1 Tax=Zea mays TaxID=4577 RepID=A0A1D6IXB0_MAIZE|nr:P-loop containing nucleoside triphosphate hydrolase superfamily protein [Zea mays]